MRCHLAPVASVLLAVSLAPSTALGAWPHSSTTNLAVCTATNTQDYPKAVSDGAGGAIITWIDFRSATTEDIYAQHVLASGSVDPAWPSNGRAICTAAGSQWSPVLVSDGAGGAIITWYDDRGADSDIYAQHVLASGSVDPAWPANGRALCTAPKEQLSPVIVSDGTGGAIVAWYDFRTSANDIYAQHVMASGAVDPSWPSDGRALCTASGDQSFPTIASDGAGGAIVTWRDFRSGTFYDIYAQRVLSSGAVAPGWPSDGRAICTAAFTQIGPQIVADGSGGAIIAWMDARAGTYYDIYAQHVLASGAVDIYWPVDGRPVCTAIFDQAGPTMVSDGVGGAIVAWYDYRGPDQDIYANHLQASGVADPTWPGDGLALCTVSDVQNSPSIVPDGAGGAIVTWQDHRSITTIDIYAQHVSATGVVDPSWPAQGRAVCTAPTNKDFSTSISDGAGGVIATWEDRRLGTNDIWAQRVEKSGYLGTPEPVIVSVKDVPNDQGGRVNLAWDASWLDTDPSPIVDHYWVLRSLLHTDATKAMASGAPIARLGPGVELADGARLVSIEGTSTYYWEYLATVPALHIVSGYGYLAATTGDSTGAYNPPTYFMVAAFNASGSQYWLSPPDSGYSVDNLSPATPAPLTGSYVAGATHLHWNPNPEADLAGYRVYRGSSAGFVPGPGNLVASPPDTGYADTGPPGSYYKLSAVDLHGNESGFALLSPQGTTGVSPAEGPHEVALSAPRPNPAVADVELRFALPSEGRVSLRIYDAGGRLTRTLAEGILPAGEHSATWDLRDDGGHRARAGLYFVRLETQGRVLGRKLAVAN